MLNVRDTFNSFFNDPRFQSESLPSSSPLIQFCNFIKKESEPSTALIHFFGRIQQKRILKRLDYPLRTSYQEESNNILNDFKLILEHNYENLKKFLTSSNSTNFKPLPQTKNYSWDQKKSASSPVGLQHNIQNTVSNFIFSHPMPLQVAQALGLSDLPKIMAPLIERQKGINKVSQTLLKLGRAGDFEAGLTYIAFKYPFAFEVLALKHCAVVKNGKFKSWIKEALKWDQNKGKVESFNEFRVCSLLDLTVQKYFKDKGINKGKEKNLHIKTFKDFIIKKTLEQITSFCPIPEIYVELYNRFEKSEKARQLTCFYLYVLNELYNESTTQAFPYPLIELLKPTLDNPNAPLIEQALSILNRISKDPNTLEHKALTALTHVYDLQKNVLKDLTLKEKQVIFQLYYNSNHLVCERVIELLKFISEVFPILRLPFLETYKLDSLEESINCLDRIKTIYPNDKEKKLFDSYSNIIQESDLQKDTAFSYILSTLPYYFDVQRELKNTHIYESDDSMSEEETIEIEEENEEDIEEENEEEMDVKKERKLANQVLHPVPHALYRELLNIVFITDKDNIDIKNKNKENDNFIDEDQEEPFQASLIKKTLDQITAICPIPKSIHNSLISLFQRSEFHREAVCLYIHILNELFTKPNSSLSECSKTFLNRAFFTQDTLIDKAQGILNQISGSELNASLKELLEIITCIFALKKEFKFLTLPEMKGIFRLIYILKLKYEDIYKLVDLLSGNNFKNSSIRLNILTTFNDINQKKSILRRRYKCLQEIQKTYESCINNKMSSFEILNKIIRSNLSKENDGNIYYLFLLLPFYLYIYGEKPSEVKDVVTEKASKVDVPTKEISDEKKFSNLLPLPLIRRLTQTIACWDKDTLNCFEKITTTYLSCVHSLCDPYLSIKDIIESASLKDSEKAFFLHLLDFLHCLFYIDLTEETKEFLVEELNTINNTEREIYHKNLTDYGNYIKTFITRTQNMYDKRIKYFQSVYFPFYAKKWSPSCSFPEIENLLETWPFSFKEFTNTPVIHLLKDLYPKKLPIEIFINILLYPVFLPSIFPVLEIAKKYYNSIKESKNDFFIPVTLAMGRDKIVESIVNPDNVINNLRGDHPGRFIERLGQIANLLGTSLYPEPFFVEPINLSTQATFNQHFKDYIFLFQNQLFQLDKTPLSPLCIANWDIQKNFPVLELTFVHSKENFESRTALIPLDIYTKDLISQDKLVSLLKIMLKELCEEIRDPEWGEKIKKMSNLTPEAELNLCLEMLPDFKEAHDIYVKENPGSKKTILELIKFIKQIKIFARSTLVEFDFPRKGDRFNKKLPLSEFATQDPIYSFPEGLSLIPPSLISEDKNKEYHLKKSDYQQKLHELCKIITSTFPSKNISSFFEFLLEGKKYKIDINFHQHDLSDLETIPERFRRNYRQLEFTLRTTPPCTFTLTIPNSRQKATPQEGSSTTVSSPNSTKSNFKNDSQLENFLLWGLASLLKKYYKMQETKGEGCSTQM